MSQLENFGSQPPSGASTLEEDLAALRPKPRPVGWFVAGLVTLLGLGFALGYYTPLSRAHDALLQKHEELARKAAELDQSLKTTGESLKAAEARRNALEKFVAQGADLARGQKSQFEIAEATAKNELKSFEKAKLLSLSVREEGLVAEVQASALFRPNSDALAPSAARVLCGLADLTKREDTWRLRAEAFGDFKDEKKYWELSGKRASAIGELLMTKCQLDEQKIEVISVRPSEGSDKTPLEILVGPAQVARLKAADAPAP